MCSFPFSLIHKLPYLNDKRFKTLLIIFLTLALALILILMLIKPSDIISLPERIFSNQNLALINYYKTSNGYIFKQMPKNIKESHSEIWFFGMDFHIHARDQQKNLLSALEAGVNIKYLIFNPDSNQITQVANDFGESPDMIKRQGQDGLKKLQILKEEWGKIKKHSKNPGEIEIRMFETTPRMRGYYFDPLSFGGKAYIVPYMNKMNSKDLPGYMFECSEDCLVSGYFQGVKKMWEESQTTLPRVKSQL